ncbi:hypothetical protein Dimus_005552 [Dionaea muscipula]
MDCRAKGKGQASISRSYASVTISDMRSDVKLSYVPQCKSNGGGSKLPVDVGVSDSGVGVPSVTHELAPELPCGGPPASLSPDVLPDVPTSPVGQHLDHDVCASWDPEWTSVGSHRGFSGRTAVTGDRDFEVRSVSPQDDVRADEEVLRHSLDHEHGRADRLSLPSSPGPMGKHHLVGGQDRLASVDHVDSPQPVRPRKGKGRRKKGA